MATDRRGDAYYTAGVQWQCDCSAIFFTSEPFGDDLASYRVSLISCAVSIASVILNEYICYVLLYYEFSRILEGKRLRLSTSNSVDLWLMAWQYLGVH